MAAKEKKTKPVKMARVSHKYDFVLAGKSPLLMHWDNLEGSDDIGHWIEKNKKNKEVKCAAGDDRTPVWTWKTYVYNDGTHIALPCENLMAALLKAGAQIVLSGNTTFKAITQSGIIPTAPYFDFLSNDTQISMAAIEAIDDEWDFRTHMEAVRKLGFELLAKRAKVNSAKHVRVRPRFDTWQVAGTVIVTNSAITKDKLCELFEIAGDSVGLGDWRPGSPRSPGRWGRFDAEVKQVK